MFAADFWQIFFFAKVWFDEICLTRLEELSTFSAPLILFCQPSFSLPAQQPTSSVTFTASSTLAAANTSDDDGGDGGDDGDGIGLSPMSRPPSALHSGRKGGPKDEKIKRSLKILSLTLSHSNQLSLSLLYHSDSFSVSFSILVAHIFSLFLICATTVSVSMPRVRWVVDSEQTRRKDPIPPSKPFFRCFRPSA